MVNQTGAHHLEPIAHLVPELKSMVDERQWDILKELLVDISPLDLADSWYRFSKSQQLQLFKLMDPQVALVLFESFNLEDQTALLKSLEGNNVATLLEGIDPKDISDIFHKLSKSTVRKMLSFVKTEGAVEKIQQVMKHDAGTAGALMHPEFIKLTVRMTARNALNLIQSITIANRKNLLRSLYVVSSEGTVIGGVHLEDLVSAPPDSLITDFMTSVEPFKLSAATDQEHVAAIFAKYDLLSAPVLDDKDQLEGVIIIDDIVDVISAEATEDVAKIAGTSAGEFGERSIFRIAWFRAPWLFATLLTQVGVSFVVRRFHFVLEEVIALATFMPLVAAMGGNVGSQSAMIFIRGLAVGRFKGKAKYFAVLREATTGLILGVLYGSVVGAVAYMLYGSEMGLDFIFVVMVSVCIAMVWAAAAGAAGPILFEKLGVDPATAMGPMVTSTTDLFSITVYLSLGWFLLVRI